MNHGGVACVRGVWGLSRGIADFPTRSRHTVAGGVGRFKDHRAEPVEHPLVTMKNMICRPREKCRVAPRATAAAAVLPAPNSPLN